MPDQVPLMTPALPSTSTPFLRRAVLTAALAAAALAGASAQAPSPQPASPQTGQVQRPAPPDPSDTQPLPPVTFRAEIDYVEVDAVVTDERGNLVKGLSKEDFEIFEDGKPQKVAFFSSVVIPVERFDRFVNEARPIVPDVRSNLRPFDGRIYVLLLDDRHTGALRSAGVKRAAHEFIDKYFGANDIAAVIHTGGRTDAGQEFTNDPRLLKASIDKFIGQKLRSRTLERLDEYNRNPLYRPQTNEDGSSTDPQKKLLDPRDFERGYFARATLGTLKNLAEFMGSIRGRRKAILMFSEGIDYPILDVFDSRDASTVLEDTRQAISAASRANVNFYTIDPRGLHTMGDETMEMGGFPQDPSFGLNPQALEQERRIAVDSLRVLAEQTGGAAAVESNDFADAFDRIQRENSSYYVLGYYPPSNKRDGKFHRIEVKLKRPGLRVVARKGYAAPKGKPETPVVDPSAGTSTALRELLNSPLQAPGLTLSVAAATFDSVKENVAVTVEIVGRNLKFTQDKGLFNNTVEVSMLPLEARGKAQQGRRSEVKLTLKPQTAQIMSATAVRMSPRLTLPPGRYQLRVAARESGEGLTGSVFYDLEVPDFTKEKFNMSGVVLTSATAQVTPTAEADPVLKQALPGPPTTRREFYPIDVLALYAEVYDRLKGDVPHTVDVTTRLVSEQGTEVTRFTDARKSSEYQGAKGGMFGYSQQVPLADVPPGRYLLQVEAKARLRDAPSVRREMLITVVQPPPDLVRPAGAKPGEGGGDAPR
jgi:VWFA-related protein